MPQAPLPPTAQERPHQELLTHLITKMELPPQHRTTPDRNGLRDLPRAWAPGHLGTTGGPPPPPPHHPRGCRSPTNGGRAHNSSPRPRRQHTPTNILGTHDDAPGPHPMASHRHHLPRPERPHTHTWQQRWEDIREDLLQEHLGLTGTHQTLHLVPGVGQAPHGMDTPGLWAYATPINPQAAEDIRTALSIRQAQTQTPQRNTQRGYTIL